jgi:hypothetical protein
VALTGAFTLGMTGQARTFPRDGDIPAAKRHGAYNPGIKGT